MLVLDLILNLYLKKKKKGGRQKWWAYKYFGKIKEDKEDDGHLDKVS